MTPKDYKPQIDGLRALAVLPVIFFHAGFQYFQGGFVGVDVFFVISGYLITKIILKDIKQKKFSLINFYKRRARRILPALYFIVLFSIPFAIFIMNKEQLHFYSEQIISVLIFVSNFFFWNNTGYFNHNSDLQPLLHTWSLSVEEQFYIIFPIIILFLSKYFKNRIVFFIILISLISLAASQIGGNFKIQNISSQFPFLSLPFDVFWQAGAANFYLPFGRIWELMLGSLIAILIKKKISKKTYVENIFSLTGFGMIVLSIIFFSESLLYPSLFTLLPCIGTGLIIVYANDKTYLYKFLTLKPIVFLGLVSYSLYLWHQPILALNRIQFGYNLNFFHTLVLLIISFFLSIFTWKFIEQPFRKKAIINDRKFLKILFLSFTIISVISCFIYFDKIKSKRFEIPNKIQSSIQMADNKGCLDIEEAHLNSQKEWYCELGKKNENISFAIIGDSHALAMKPGFDIAAKEIGQKGIMTGFSGCPGLIGIQSIRNDIQKRNCKKLSEKFYEFVKEKKIKKLFLISRWTYYTDGEYHGRNFQHITNKNNLFQSKKNSRYSFQYGLENTIKKFEEMNVEVNFVNQVPLQHFSAKLLYENSYDKSKNKVDISKLRKNSINKDKSLEFQSFVRKELNSLKSKGYNFNIIDLHNFFCDDRKCLVGNGDFSYYSDENHLSIKGSITTKNFLKQYLK